MKRIVLFIFTMLTTVGEVYSSTVVHPFHVIPENTGILPVEDRINKIQILATDRMIMQESGFLEVFANNDANTPVYYDNLTVMHTPGRVLEINTYYPYGMIIPELSAKAALKDEQNWYKFSAKELETALNLNMYDFGARMYDPAIGRWLTPDPLAEKYYSTSPFMYCLGNPIRYIDPYGLWTQTANGWTTNDLNDISRFMNMMNIETYKNQNISMDQINTFVHEEFMGTGGKLSDGSVLLSEVTVTKNAQGKWEVPEYQMAKMYQEVDYWGSLVQNRYGSERLYKSAGFEGGEHFIGPGLILLGQPIRSLKPVGALGSKPGSSIASYTLSKAFPQKITNVLGKKTGTKIATRVGTNTIGRAAGRFIPYVGWGVTIYDVTTTSFRLGQEHGPSTWFGDNDEKWFK